MRKYIAVVLLLMLSIGCAQQQPIPEKEFTAMLVDMFIADATVIAPQYRADFSRKDTIEYYKSIVEKYGYTTVQFDSTMSFYSAKPKLLDAIFDNVVNELSKMQETLKMESQARVDSLNQIAADSLRNHWDQKVEFALPADGRQNTIAYKIPVVDVGIYTLKAKVTVYLEDEAVNPCMTAYFVREGEAPDALKSRSKRIAYTKDGFEHEVSLEIELNDKRFTHICGKLAAHEATLGDWSKRMRIRDISLTFKQRPMRFDKKVLKANIEMIKQELE